MASVMSLPVESPELSSSSSVDLAIHRDEKLELVLSNEDHKNYKEEEDFEKPSAKRRKLDQELAKALEGSKPSHKELCPPHPGFIGGRCFICQQLEVNKSRSVALTYMKKGLRMSRTEIDRLRHADRERLLHAKTEEEKKKAKLILILDLDHTLLNSTLLTKMSPEEEYLKHQSESMQSDPSSSFKVIRVNMLAKLRPFVRTFLHEASSMFEMYIYTMADHSYAHEIAKILDPNNIYFDQRVISKSDSTKKSQKSLDIVVAPESAVVILDDTKPVWKTENRENLIRMERYHFFSSSCRRFGIKSKSLAELKIDETEEDGALSIILNVLKRAREMFFETDDDSSKDMRKILKIIRQETLKGCKIVFSRVIHSTAQGEDEPIWETARHLGAICSAVMDSSVTHVVSLDKTTVKAQWAVQNEKFLVTPRWIEAAYFLWKRQPEKNFEIPESSKSPPATNAV